MADKLSAGNQLVVANRRIQLRPIMDSDRSWLFDLYVGEETGFRWMLEGAVPTQMELPTDLGFLEGYPIRWIIGSPNTDTQMGVLLVGPIDIENSTAQFGICMAPSYVGSGRGVVAMLLCCHVLFDRLHMRKLYTYAPEFNEANRYRNLRKFAAEEVRLRDHHFFCGRYWDVRIYGILRSEWESLIRPSYQPLLRQIECSASR